MAIKSLSHSSLTDNRFYRSMLVGNDPVSYGAYDLLETQVLTSSASSVTFTGLDTYSDYKHLQLRMVARSSYAGTGDFLTLKINSDTGSNYALHSLRGDGSSVFSAASTSRNNISFFLVSDTATSNAFHAYVMDILDFSDTSKNTTTRTLSGRADSVNAIDLRSGLWNNTAAITSLTFDTTAGFSGNFVAGSRFSLYGIKGA